MLSVSVNGNNLPANSRTQFDSITKQEVFDHNAYLFNIVFDSFRQTYTSGLGVCKSNFAFRPHSEAYDSTAVHNL
jgi:hypothetical protein